MEIPWGTYGRIATRSSAALKLGLDIGAGVIDSDYRGEVKILAFNHSDQNIYIHKGDCVAQLILEYIVMTNVYELVAKQEDPSVESKAKQMAAGPGVGNGPRLGHRSKKSPTMVGAAPCDGDHASESRAQ
ncbi:deoxyuridine 5'-triphosphate nucleotidohydrolase-like [Zingiber officinale]|uniref:deoxyuridine 5'-triphosphate nucleotidohydrolase-like n=1 Tax=Zingiber officinale TaxID=94328 RepID=UPI001C4CD8C4|nr:deoxyuridine 5'-triphosphate nucleotidohydrolase-like [Zingiber officinale]